MVIKPIVIGISLLVVFSIFLFFQPPPPKTPEEINVCGDGICGITEDCRNCVEDCGCPIGEYCDELGICRKEVCGDGICSSYENKTQTCCEDCGCPIDKICNKITQTCQERPIISYEEVKTIATNYLRERNITGTILRIFDTYYKNFTVKQVVINCKIEDIPFPCEIVLYINNAGEIIEELRTI